MRDAEPDAGSPKYKNKFKNHQKGSGAKEVIM
jgi:hypothetical protein